MTLNDILSWLTQEQITYTLHHDGNQESLEKGYTPASLKGIITEGIYFVQDVQTLSAYNLKQSILFAPSEIPTSNIVIVVENPQRVHYKLSQCFVSPITYAIHPTAIVSPEARLHEKVSVGPYCIVGACELEEGVILKNHVVIEDHVKIGKRSFVDSHSVIGAGGLAWIWDQDGTRIMQAQLGGVVIGEDCILATDITVVKGSLTENTSIGDGTVIAHGTKIGHGSQIGKQVHMANNVSLAGNSVIGDFSFLGSACVISSNVHLPKHTIVGASALVNKNFEDEYLTLAGVPAQIIKRNNFEEKPKGAPQPLKRN